MKEKVKYVATHEELGDLIYALKDDAEEILEKIMGRGALVEKKWELAVSHDDDLGGFLSKYVGWDCQSWTSSTGCRDLPQALWGDPKEVKTIYIRDWYKRTAKEIVKNCKELSTCIVAGSSGMGKSVFGLVLLMHALDAGLYVAYQKGSKRYWIVGVEGLHCGDKVSLSRLRLKCEEYEYAAANTPPGVYRVTADVELFDELCHLPQVLHIVDLDDSVDCDVSPFGRKVIITSPNSDKLMRIGTMDDPRYIYVPLWSLEELQMLNEKLPEAAVSVVPKPLYRKLSAEVLKELYEKFGGVPQTIFKNESVQMKLCRLQDTIQETPLEVLRVALNSHCYSRLSNVVPSMLFHFTEDPTHPEEDCRVEFVSDYVMSAVTSFHDKEEGGENNTSTPSEGGKCPAVFALPEVVCKRVHAM